MPFTPKQQRFIEEYPKDCNATQAAIRAGYSEKTARQIGQQLLSKLDIWNEINKKQAIVTERCELSVEWVLNNFKEISERCMQHVPVLDRKGNQVITTTPAGELAAAYTFDASGAIKANENIGKHLGMFKEGKENQEGNFKDLLAVLRQSGAQ